jgi:hypothetical protein
MYIMTPNDQMSQLLSYFSGPRTSGATKNDIENTVVQFLLMFTL